MTHSTTRVGASWFTLFTLAWLAIWAVQLTPLQLLIPLHLNTPGGPEDWIGGVVSSGLVLGAGGVAAVIAGPLAGALSDRTRSRWGRRRPWALGGAWTMVAGLIVLAFAAGPWAVGAAWVGVSVGFAVAGAAFTALIADQLTAQRGVASAAVGSAQALGLIVGVGAIALLELGIVSGYLVLAAAMAVIGTAATLLLPDPAPDALSAMPASSAGRRLADRFALLRDRDFAWLLAGRFTANLGNALGTTLLLFFLLYGVGTPAAQAEDDLLLLILVYTLFVVAASVIGGRYSDRTGRRRPLVVAAALVQAVAATLLAVAPTYPAALVAAAILGVGYGAFNSIGLALATDLLPRAEDHARDLGVVNVSANLGQLLGPLAGAALVAAVGGFWLLFAVAAALSVAGAGMTARVSAPALRSRRPAVR